LTTNITKKENFKLDLHTSSSNSVKRIIEVDNHKWSNEDEYRRKEKQKQGLGRQQHFMRTIPQVRIRAQSHCYPTTESDELIIFKNNDFVAVHRSWKVGYLVVEKTLLHLMLWNVLQHKPYWIKLLLSTTHPNTSNQYPK
jgi:hypothetical protein